MNKTTLYIVRHGQTEWNQEGRLQGHMDSPLTKLGELQARSLYEPLKNVQFDCIYSSPSLRALHTAELITGNKKGEIVKIDEFKEIYFGEWEGQLEKNLEKKFPEQFTPFKEAPHLYRNDSGESFFDVQKRVLPKLSEIINKHTGSNILIVAHNVVIKIILAHFQDSPMADIWKLPPIKPASLSKVEIMDDIPKILLFGEISHYKDQL